MRNEDALIAIRPDLSHLDVSEASDAEVFQNVTLRPLLKMQHDLLVVWIKQFVHFDQLSHHAKDELDYNKLVKHFIQQTPAAKFQLIGLVVGHFTMEEWLAYSEQSAELNRRIITMAAERIAGALYVD